MNKEEALIKFKNKWDGCTKCPLSQFRKQVVFGTGNLNAGVLLLGESPGEEEDNGGLPFQGRAGGILDKILETFKIPREDLWITNVCICRPKAITKANRAPTSKEISACNPRLLEEIDIIRPKIIVAMGNTPLYLITGKRGITSRRGWLDATCQGEDYKVDGIYSTLHPASLLYGSTEQILIKKKALYADWLEIARKYFDIKKEESHGAS